MLPWGQTLRLGQRWTKRKAVGLGMGALGVATGRMGATAAGAFYGGMYGALADDTSITGGALTGAAIGRYGTAGLRGARRSWDTAAGLMVGGSYGRAGSMLISNAGRNIYRTARSDIGQARILANNGFNKIRSSLSR